MSGGRRRWRRRRRLLAKEDSCWREEKRGVFGKDLTILKKYGNFKEEKR